MDEPLDSADWQPSASAAESVSGVEELRSRHEMRLAYSGSGPPTTRIAAEVSDRKNLAFHIRTKRQKKREASPTDPAAAGADARKERLDSHLRQITGMTEAERITDAVNEILVGERAEDERALRRWHEEAAGRLRQYFSALFKEPPVLCGVGVGLCSGGRGVGCVRVDGTREVRNE